MSKSMAQLGLGSVIAIVLLRLAVGWHFYSEGLKKLEPGFSSAGFLRAATGPLAPLYHSKLPNPYDYDTRLASPRQADSLTAEQKEENSAWQKTYDEKVKNAQRAKETNVADFRPYGPYSDWAKAIAADWARKRDKAAKKLEADPEPVYRKHLQKLADYFAANEEDIEVFRHELWRVERMRDQPGAGQIAYLDNRIDEKSAEIFVTSQQWPADIATLETNYINDLAALDDSPEKQKKLAKQLHDPSPLDWIDPVVTCVVLGVGGCMLLGFCTRLAGVVGMLFLLSVMASQPPWVVGANTQVFGYQLVEVMVMLTLAAVGAGQWFGLDSLFGRLCSSCCSSNKAAANSNADS